MAWSTALERQKSNCLFRSDSLRNPTELLSGLLLFLAKKSPNATLCKSSELAYHAETHGVLCRVWYLEKSQLRNRRLEVRILWGVLNAAFDAKQYGRKRLFLSLLIIGCLVSTPRLSPDCPTDFDLQVVGFGNLFAVTKPVVQGMFLVAAGQETSDQPLNAAVTI